MSEARYFTVRETREVKVRALDPIDAGRIARAAFTNGQNSDNGVKDGPAGVWGNTTSRVTVTDTEVSEDR